MRKKCKYGKPFAVYGLWFVVLYGLGFLLFISCNEGKKQQTADKQQTTNDKQKLIYYCPMHPEVQQDHPGRCPRAECHGMELVLKTSDELLDKVLKPVNNSVLASVKTVHPVFQKINLDVSADGYIDYDSRTENNISSLYSGRIEKLYVRYAYQSIHKGEKIFEIYSPEIVTAQENLVYLLKNDSGETSLINAAKQKLRLLGFTEKLLNEITQSGKVMQTVPVYSSYEGHAHAAMKMSAEMNGMPSQNNVSGEELPVKEGMYVMMGETVFNVVNPHEVAVVLQIKPEDISKVEVGSEVEITIADNTGMTMNGKVDFIEPVFKQGLKTMTAKIYIDNSEHNHKVGTLVKARIKGVEIEALWIPLSALVDLGKEKIVFVKQDGNFFARKVETGIMTNDMTEVADGLTEADEIASEAHYLVDSEAFIKSNGNEK